MKNIHVIATDKPSRLYLSNYGKELNLSGYPLRNYTTGQNIYITSDEEIKEGDYFLYDETEIRYKTNGTEYHGRDLCHISGNRRYPVNKSKKIILTTDQSLDSIQAIDDEFLEWFVKNPSCEVIKVNKLCYGALSGFADAGYKIIIPKEEPKQVGIDWSGFPKSTQEKVGYVEPKQETLEEAAREYYKRGQLGFEAAADTEKAFIKGAKWQAEQNGLMEIELRHTKTLLTSCEKALEDRDKQQERSYSLDDIKEAYSMGKSDMSIRSFNEKFKTK